MPSPDPAFSDVQVPIASSFLLSSKKGKEAWVQPIVDKARKVIDYRIRTKGTKTETENANKGTKQGRGASFRCLFSDAAITPEHVKTSARHGKMGSTIIAVVAAGRGKRIYLAPDAMTLETVQNLPEAWAPNIPLSKHPQYMGVSGYGFETFGDLFNERQKVALEALTTHKFQTVSLFC